MYAAELMAGYTMTRKRAIKIIMAVTGHGDKRAASNTFDMVKKCIVGNPSNADVCYRTLAPIYNKASADPEPCFYTFRTIARAWLLAKLLRDRYGTGIGGTLIGDAEV